MTMAGTSTNRMQMSMMSKPRKEALNAVPYPVLFPRRSNHTTSAAGSAATNEPSDNGAKMSSAPMLPKPSPPPGKVLGRPTFLGATGPPCAARFHASRSRCP